MRSKEEVRGAIGRRGGRGEGGRDGNGERSKIGRMYFSSFSENSLLRRASFALWPLIVFVF